MSDDAGSRAPLPTKRQLIDFIQEHPTTPSRREIARAFRLRGADRSWLRETLRELEDDGLIERKRGRRVGAPGRLPSVAVIEVAMIDDDGDVLCKPVAEGENQVDATILLRGERGRPPPVGLGDRVLARLRRLSATEYEARTIKRLGPGSRPFIAVFETDKRGGTLRPVNRRTRTRFDVSEGNRGGAEHGDYVRAEPLPGGRASRQARVIERLGAASDPRMFSLLALHSRDIPIDFQPDALHQAESLKPATLGKRTDLRDIPLITIDGADARDFDDAVWAEPDTAPDNPKGWHAIVAIADVAWYVRPGDPLDRAAWTRGNSIYFPDRVVPMLPERLSNGLCSLRPNEDRACVAVHLWIDAEGHLKRHRFVRGLMRSAARLTYEQVQKARDGNPDDATGPLKKPVLDPLFGVYDSLRKARDRRGTLELDIPERQITLGEDGHIAAITPRSRYDSHRLIEELMIAANVAAAETLNKAMAPSVQRIHEAPTAEAVANLREALGNFGIRLAKGGIPRPSLLAGVLKQASETDYADLVSDLVLRSQTQAYYGTEDLGHFGLALRRYCHFTSPIRRYADILVHRALISTLGLGDGGLSPDELDRLDETSEHISATERRAVFAERDAMDRLTAAFLADRVGAEFSARISGVTRFGLFVRLEETGADGLVPMRALPADWYDHDEIAHRLIGEKSGIIYTLGDRVTVQLSDADPATGSLTFSLIEGGRTPKDKKARGTRPGRTNRRARKSPSRRKRSR